MLTQTRLFAKTPTLVDYDVILVNSSAGKDSQAMLTEIHRLAEEAGVLDRVIVVHADLGRVEWAGTVDLAREQAEHYGFRFEVVQRSEDLLTQVWRRYHTLCQRKLDGGVLVAAGVDTWGKLRDANRQVVAAIIGDPSQDFADQVQPEASTRARKIIARGKANAKKKAKGGEDGAIDFGQTVPWPSSVSRYCTSDQKTNQVTPLITRLHRQSGGRPGFRVLNCLGIRAQESSARAKKPPFHKDGASTARRHVDRWLPIFDWSEERVWDTIHESGVRYHWAYDKGMERLSCAFCVFASKSDLQIAKAHNPNLFQAYLKVEEDCGHSFRANFWLKSIE